MSPLASLFISQGRGGPHPTLKKDFAVHDFANPPVTPQRRFLKTISVSWCVASFAPAHVALVSR